MLMLQAVIFSTDMRRAPKIVKFDRQYGAPVSNVTLGMVHAKVLSTCVGLCTKRRYTKRMPLLTAKMMMMMLMIFGVRFGVAFQASKRLPILYQGLGGKLALMLFL